RVGGAGPRRPVHRALDPARLDRRRVSPQPGRVGHPVGAARRHPASGAAGHPDRVGRRRLRRELSRGARQRGPVRDPDAPGRAGAAAALRSWVRQEHVSLIASSLGGGRANSAFAFGPTGALLGRYDKVRLVPFAEYGERPGRARTVLRTPEAAIGIAICYESIFPDIARQYARRGATMLAVLTNDAWFGGRAAPAQH